MKNIFLVLLVFLFGAVEIGSQVIEEWVARYDGPDHFRDDPQEIAVDDSGNVYVTGKSEGIGVRDDYTTIKYDRNGNPVWVRRYNGPANLDDEAKDIVVDGLGNIYVTGFSYGIGTSRDYLTIKYSSTGDTLWVRRYSGPLTSGDEGHALAIDDSGNIYVTGVSGIGTGNGGDYATIKYNTTGDSLWVKRYNTNNALDKATDIVIDESGNIIVTGASCCTGGFADFATIKYNSNGNTLWVRKHPGAIHPNISRISLAVDDSGNTYITDFILGSDFDYLTVKYDINGDTVWSRIYNSPGNDLDMPHAIAVDNNGNVYVTGVSGSEFATLRYNRNGALIWERRYSGAGSDIALDDLSNIYVTGGGISSGMDSEFTTIKYNLNGDTLWVMNYDGTTGTDPEYAVAVVVDGSGNVYVTGTSTKSGNEDYVTIKYSQTVGVEEENSEFGIRNAEFGLMQNQPNPLSKLTTISYIIPDSHPASGIPNHVSLNIYDITGKLVESLVDENKKAGVYQVEWDGKEQSSGIYFYRLKTSNFTETKKMILLR
jgi:uncharacterized delta-60 repeat protein